MPLEQRVISPIFVSRGCFNLDSVGQMAINIPNELECVTNGTLSNIIRQLSSLSKHAEDLFGCLLDDVGEMVQRSASLQARLGNLMEHVEQLDASSESSSTSFYHRKPLSSRTENFDQQVVARNTIPRSLREVYEMCDQPPPLDKLNPFRDDNINGLKLYTNPNYFFELWRKEMLADRSRNKVAKNKQGDNVHITGKSKRKQSRGHQNSNESSNALNTPPNMMMSKGNNQILPNEMVGAGSYSIYGENDNMSMLSHQQKSINAYQQQQPHHAQAQSQHMMAQHNNAISQPIYNYQQNSGGVQSGEMIAMIKREESNPSGVGTYTVIEGSYIDPNNYQHHYVQHQYNNANNSAQQNPPPPPPPPPNSNDSLQISKPHQSRPNSLELSNSNLKDSQQHYNQSDSGYYSQYNNSAAYGAANQKGSNYGAPNYSSNQQYSTSPSSTLTPTRRAAQLSRPTAPPPAPPSESAPNSNPSTPIHKKMVNGQEVELREGAAQSRLVSRDSLPPPPPPPPNNFMGNGIPADSETTLPPPPPPPPPSLPNTNFPTTGAYNSNPNNMSVNSPPPPPPPPISLNSNGPIKINPSANHKNMNVPSAQSFKSSKPTAEELQSVKLKKTTPVQAEPVDARNDLLAAIRHGIKLKRVEESRAREVEKSVPHDVASILARRVAIELSDSEGEAEDDGDDSDGWDDESEC